MALVADLARAKNMDVARAGELVAKVHAGSLGPLKRLGIEYTATTTNVDRLKAAHERASLAQKANKQTVDELSKDQLKAAQAADKQANSQAALGLLQGKLKGQAAAYGKTTAGSVDRANVAFENLEETIGGAVAPTVEKAATKVADFVNEMQDGTGQGGRFVRKLKEIWQEVKPIVQWMGRAARAIGQFTLEHPGLVKLAASIVAVGVAVRGLRFVSAVTGFSALLKGGRAAARGLQRIFASAGTNAGEAAATNAAAGFGGKGSKFTAAGKKAGRLVGKGLAIGAVIGAAAAASDALDNVIGQIRKRFGDFAGDAANSFKGPLGLLENLVGKDLTPGASNLEDLAKKLGLATGGVVPGSGRGDTVPAMLEPGEFVIRRKVVEKFGPTFFAGINGGMGQQGQGQVPGFTSGGIVSRANKMAGMGLPYLWGGGHGGSISRGVDCSGAVSWALGVSPRVSGAFASYGQPGPGSPNDTKIYANAKHVFAVFNGRGWGTSAEHPGGGPGWLSYNHRPGFTVRHLNDAGSGGSSTSGDPQETSEAGKQQLERNEDRIAALRGQLAGLPKGKAGASRRSSIQGSIRGLQESNRLLRRSISNAPSAAEVRDRRIAREERSGSRAVNKLVARFGSGPSGFAATGRAAAGLGGMIEGADTAYGQLERQFGQTDEDLGTAGGRTARISELAALAGEKRKQLNRQKKRAGLLRQAISKLEGLLRAGRKQRDRAKGAKRAKINERLRTYDDRLTDLKGELVSLGFAIRDTELDIGDLAKEAKEVAGTPDTEVEAGPTASDRVSDLIGLVDLKERAGELTSAQAQAQKTAILQSVLGGSLGPLDERTRLQLQGDLIEVQQAGVAAVEDNTSAIRDLQKSIEDNTAFARSVMATENTSLLTSISDLISGQIAGVGIAGRALTPSGGFRARY
jgi:hypothetical protein